MAYNQMSKQDAHDLDNGDCPQCGRPEGGCAGFDIEEGYFMLGQFIHGNLRCTSCKEVVAFYDSGEYFSPT